MKHCHFYVYLIVIATLCGCHKKDNGPYVSAINVSGTQAIGFYIDFTYATAGNGKLTVNSTNWDFGDGSSSTNYSGQHAYSSPGAYTVTLTVNGKKLSQDVTIGPAVTDFSVLSKMVGLRHWKGGGSGYCLEFAYDEIQGSVKIDTDLTLVSPSTGIITFPFNLNVYVNQLDSVNKVFYFSGYTSPAKVAYFYSNDSIVYTDIWSGTIGNTYESLVIHSY